MSDGESMIASGLIRVASNPVAEKVPLSYLPEGDEEEVMNTKDIYKELSLRGYQFMDCFRSLKSASISRTKGHIAWMGNWLTFIDGMLQMQLLEMDTRDLYVPTKIQKIVIDTKLHQQELQKLDFEDKRKCASLLSSCWKIFTGTYCNLLPVLRCRITCTRLREREHRQVGWN